MRSLLTAVLGLAVTLGPAMADGKRPQSLDDCDALVLRSPDHYASYWCYWIAARRTGRWADAAARLDARLALEPDNHLARQYLAAIEADRGRDRAEL